MMGRYEVLESDQEFRMMKENVRVLEERVGDFSLAMEILLMFIIIPVFFLKMPLLRSCCPFVYRFWGIPY